jgi:phosphatidylserine/phosphatidylglycerophosphate/cardiolipin synthase-like enzyme
MTARGRRRRLRKEVLLLRVPPLLALLFVLAASAGLLIAGTRSGGASNGAPDRYRAGDRSGQVGIGTTPSALLIEPGDGARPLVRLIDHTQRSLFLECYILSDRQVIRALERASAQDVGVYVLLEPHPLGMGTQPQRVADELAAAGVAVRWTRPVFALTHAKFLVSDDSTAVIASANFSHAGLHSNRDLLVIDRQVTDVRAASAVFRADWDGSTPLVRDSNIVISPDNARARLSRLLSRAHRSVSIYAEEVGDAAMERELALLEREGISVRLILAAGQTPTAARSLVDRGVPVRQLGTPYVHAKMVLIDGREAFVGSENLSSQSLDHNRELGLLVRGSAVDRLSATFDSDWNRAAPVTR